MTLATLDQIGSPSEPWTHPSNGSRLVFIDLRFADHEPARLGVKDGYVDARLKELAERVGHPEEWEFGTSSTGKPTVKIPKAEDAVPSSGGKGKWTPKTPEERAEILAMNAMSAWAAVQAGDPALDALSMVKKAMRVLMAEARSILNVEAAVSGDESVNRRPAPNSAGEPTPVRSASTNVGTEGTQPSAGGETLPSVAGTTPPHPYLGNRDIAEPCRVLGCELQEENPIHVKRGQQ